MPRHIAQPFFEKCAVVDFRHLPTVFYTLPFLSRVRRPRTQTPILCNLLLLRVKGLFSSVFGVVFVCFSVGLRLIRPPAVPAPWCCYTIYITTRKKFSFSDFSRLSVAPVSVVIASRIEAPPTLYPAAVLILSRSLLFIGS